MRQSFFRASSLLAAQTLLIGTALAEVPAPPAGDTSTPYYDRHRIDVSNLRDFFDGILIADIMIHRDAMFDAETKWKLTLYQMITLGSGHNQARAARQLEAMGVSLDDIRAIWSPDYIQSIEDPRIRTAFEFLDVATPGPAMVTGDTHAALRTHFIDRQIAELIELVAVNAAMAKRDLILPVATDQATVEWATAHLSQMGWEVGLNAATSAEEQQADLLIGTALETAQAEIVSAWQPGDLAAMDPQFASDWVNHLTGYGITPVTFDGDRDGIEEPFDFYPQRFLEWEDPAADAANLPPEGTPPFDVTGYDYDFIRLADVADATYPLSDRNNFDTEWARESSIGTVKIDEYFSGFDRAIGLDLKWELFFVTHLAGGCGHCQVHGGYGIYNAAMEDYPHDRIPDDAEAQVIARIHALMDFERSDLFTDAEKAAYRLARDAGPMPTRTTAAHIEELRRHYSDREIQEILSLIVTAGWLSSAMQSQLTVTDRLSMAWAVRNLVPAGWKPGPHFGLPTEQRRFHMTEIVDLAMAEMNSGNVIDGGAEWLGVDVPLAVDADGDGVSDGFDGFPDDASRWEDTDHDGIEDALDDDIDGDGIANADEVAAGTFPYKADSDGDGVIDPVEIEAGTDPVDPRSL
jgi:alkylhydroperoxidase family enzyme